MASPRTAPPVLPAPDALKPAGVAGRLWSDLLAHLAATYPPVATETKALPKAAGWYVRVARKQRTILYLLPQQDHFLTVFVFGEKATQAVRASGVSAQVIHALDSARPYIEGRSIRLAVRTHEDFATMQALAAIKMQP